ncbi:hypothetical protein BH23GEM4_BH23GEM4_04450 [soil metagenome]
MRFAVRGVCLLVTLSALNSPLAAQSLLAGSGLGLPGEALDARAAALGGVGLGLAGTSFSLVNPAFSARLPAPAIVATFQPERTRSDFAGSESDFSTSRFPLITVAAPLAGRWGASIGYGAFLDQNFAFQRSDSLELAGERFLVRDTVRTSGGVARFRLAGSYAAGERFSVGAGIDLFTGSRVVNSVRFFTPLDSLGVATPLLPDAGRTEWEYDGVGVNAGVEWSPRNGVILAAAGSGGGTLDATPVGDTLAQAASYSLPRALHAGGSARLTSAATVALAGRWKGWSRADEDLRDSGGARDEWGVSGGVEYDPPSSGTRSFPLRVGARYTALPFRRGAASGDFDFPAERAITAGAGARFARGAASIDLAGERGWRGDAGAGVDESFWRASLSLTLFGR